MENIENKLTTIKRFLVGKLNLTGMNGYILGLSGGIDSAVSMALAVSAVGADKVLAITMPYSSSSTESVTDSLELAEKFGVECRKVDISAMIDAYYPSITKEIRLRAGNKMARERMSILFDLSAETGRLVMGTGNRTEICLGYTTWYGDSACSLNPVAQLYKTEIRELAVHLGITPAIINKEPSADLWSGQTDEDEIGVTYEIIDRLLVRLIEDGETSISTLESEGFHQTDISKVVSMFNFNSFKRHLPDIAPLDRKPIPPIIELLG